VAAEDSHVQEIVVDDGDNMRLEDDTQTDIMVEGDIGTGYTLPTGVGEVAAHVSLREAVGGAHLEVHIWRCCSLLPLPWGLFGSKDFYGKT
jgi:hypothetical protein